jgi:hypothetical protein
MRKIVKKGLVVLQFVLVSLLLVGCNKMEDGEVIENTFTGNVEVTSTGSDPAGDFTGSGDNGVYQFAWDNSKSKAQVNFDITSPTGSVNMVLEDKKGDEVLNETLTAGVGDDTFSGVTGEGKSGIWTVTITLTDFDGDGSYSLNPAD